MQLILNLRGKPPWFLLIENMRKRDTSNMGYLLQEFGAQTTNVQAGLEVKFLIVSNTLGLVLMNMVS